MDNGGTETRRVNELESEVNYSFKKAFEALYGPIEKEVLYSFVRRGIGHAVVRCGDRLHVIRLIEIAGKVRAMKAFDEVLGG